MAEWRVVPGDEAAARWDGWLGGFADRHLRQSVSWARHKSGRWSPVYTALFDGTLPSAMGLILMRRAPLGAATIAWANAGPVFGRGRPAAEELSALEQYLEGLQAHLGAEPRALLRLNACSPAGADAAIVLRRAGFARALTPLDSGLNMILDLRPSLDELRAGLERRWRNQLKTAEASGAELAFGGDELRERFTPLHDELCSRKGLEAQRLSREQWRRLGDSLGAQTRYLIASLDGRDAAGVGLWLFSDIAYLAFSAATEAGLKRNLPNLVYWSALARLKETGCERFDLTGIDPTGNWGVFHFKSGLGAPAHENLGEWDWSPSPWLRRAFNAALWAARGRMA